MEVNIYRVCPMCYGIGEVILSPPAGTTETPNPVTCPMCEGACKVIVNTVDITDIDDKLKDIMDKCNDIFEKLNE